MADRLDDFYAAVGPLKPAPWKRGGRFDYDQALLRDLIQVAVDTGRAGNAQTGGIALAVDVWVACELRRAGLDPDAVWPRAEQPRTLPQSLGEAAAKFKYARGAQTRQIQQQTVAKLLQRAGSGRTSVVGGQFVKEVDVAVAEHDRGLEPAVSTKAMTGSYGKNVTNRWEEASGDLLNIRRRFPLASFGFAMIVTAAIFKEKNSWARAQDMVRKLTTVVPGAEGSAYDAGCLIVADWPRRSARLHQGQVPDDLGPNQFFEKLFAALFSRSPVVFHEDARRLWLASKP